MKKKKPLARVELAPVPRSVTLLGATGSIGSSTVDLLRQDPALYRVEAVTAHRKARRWPLARELGARFAAVADPKRMANSKPSFPGPASRLPPGPRPWSRRRNARPTG